MNKIDLTELQQQIDNRDPALSTELKITSTEPEQREVSLHLTEKLWPKLSAMYGYRFMSQFGETPDSTWASCLKGITPRQIADGLNNCLEMHPEWPPGAAQFRAACLGKHLDADGNDSSWQHKSAAYKMINDPSHPSYQPKQLESDEQKEKVKTAHDKAMKDMFK